MFKISIVTDEVSSDIETALELASSWGIRNIELRGVSNQRIGSLDDFHQDNLKRNIKRFDMNVAALSPGIFKIPYSAERFEGYTVLRWQDESEYYQQQKILQTAQRHLKELLPRAITAAHDLGAKNIIVFSFNRPDMSPVREIPQFVIDFLGEAARLAEKEDINLMLENEHICWGDSAKNAIGIINKVGSKNLKLNWDLGNSYFSYEKPYPDGYSYAKDFVGHVHVKDAVTDQKTGEMSYVVNGEIDWEGQLSALLQNGYTGYVTVETHCRPKVLSAKQTLDRILAVCGKNALELVNNDP